MEIGRLNSAQPISVTERAGKAVGNADGKNSNFGEFFKDALQNVMLTDQADKATNQALMTGDLNDLHSATIAAVKADLTLQLTLQVRNRVVDAYTEIMRMQV